VKGTSKAMWVTVASQNENVTYSVRNAVNLEKALTGTLAMVLKLKSSVVIFDGKDERSGKAETTELVSSRKSTTSIRELWSPILPRGSWP
jgi:hypothetical protein